MSYVCCFHHFLRNLQVYSTIFSTPFEEKKKKSHRPKIRLNSWSNCSFNLSQKHNLNQPVWSFLVKHQLSVTWALSIPHRKERQPVIKTFFFCPQIILSFLSLIAPLLHPSYNKNLPSSTTLLVVRGDAAQIMICWAKPIFPVYSAEFCFFNIPLHIEWNHLKFSS